MNGGKRCVERGRQMKVRVIGKQVGVHRGRDGIEGEIKVMFKWW